MLGMMSRHFATLLLIVALLVSACAGPPPKGVSRIAVMGDSMMAWNGLNAAATPDALSRSLKEPVTNLAVSGARLRHPLPISSTLGFEIGNQFRKGPWKVIIVNGGANDLWFGCGCRRCTARLQQIISEDGKSGELPDLLRRLQQHTDAHIIYVGYHRAFGLRSPARHCRDELDALDARATAMVSASPGVDFVNLQSVFPRGDASYYASDIVHPSPKGSAAIANRIAPYVVRALAR